MDSCLRQEGSDGPGKRGQNRSIWPKSAIFQGVGQGRKGLFASFEGLKKGCFKEVFLKRL